MSRTKIRSLVFFIALYEIETWTLKMREREVLNVFEMWCCESYWQQDKRTLEGKQPRRRSPIKLVKTNHRPIIGIVPNCCFQIGTEPEVVEVDRLPNIS